MLVRSIVNYTDAIYVAGQYSTGIYKINKYDNTIETIEIPVLEYPKHGYQIMDMIRMHDQNILILSSDKILTFNPSKNEFKRSPLQVEHPNPSFQTVVKDKNNTYWIGSREGGLISLNFEKNSLINYTEEFNIYEPGNHRWINSLYIDSQNKLWIGNGNANAIMNLNDSIITITKSNKIVKPYKDIEDFYEDNSGRMWIASASQGLIINPIDKLYSEDKKWAIEGDGIFEVHKYNDSLLFTIGKSGFGEFNTNSLSHKKINLNIGKNIIVRNSIVSVDDDDNYLIGSNNGIISYYPQKGIINREIPKPYIRKIVGNGKILYSGSDLEISNFEFDSDVNNLTYSISALGFQSPNQISYQYKFENDWTGLASSQEINIINLSSGNYTLKVRACNNSDNCFSEPVTYNFTISTPWNRSWWAYTLYIIAIGILVLILYRFNLNKKIAIAEKQKAIELDDLKTRLYSNITHEFRTPLTVILGMVDTLKSNHKKEVYTETEKSLNMIKRNGSNLLHLVNELLDLAKVESGSLGVNLVQTDIIPFVKYLSESFHSLAEAKKINLTVYSEVDTLIMDVDTNKVASIVSNLLSNAVKFTAEGGAIIVHLNEIEEGNDSFFVIKVKDDGLGLSKENLENLFDRFYQANSNNYGEQVGTGIGRGCRIWAYADCKITCFRTCNSF